MSDKLATLNQAKAAVMLLEEALTTGLPMPFDISVTAHSPLRLMFDTRGEVDAWAVWIVDGTSHDNHAESGDVHHRFDGVVFDILVRLVAVEPAPVAVA